MQKTTSTGYGPTRKTRASAEREARLWNKSGDGSRYVWTHHPHTDSDYAETITAEAQVVEGGFACAYVTVREPVERVAAVFVR